MNEISETQSKLDELMNEYEVAVIGENRGRNRSGYSEKADKYYQRRRELKEFVAKIDGGHRWIPVSERLPEAYEKVIALAKDCMNVDWVLPKELREVGKGAFARLYNVTHWMSLPTQPEVQE